MQNKDQNGYMFITGWIKQATAGQQVLNIGGEGGGG